MDAIGTKYTDWYLRASEELVNMCGHSADEVMQGDWYFAWFTLFVAGYTPLSAATDAYFELNERGLLIERDTPEQEARDGNSRSD